MTALTRRIRLGVIGAALSMALLSAAVAFAQDDPAVPPVVEQSGAFGLRGQVIERVGDLALIRFVANELNLTARDVVRQLRAEDLSLAQVVANAGADPDAVLNAAVAAAVERVTTALENGPIDATRAETLIAELESRIVAQFNTSPLQERVFQLGERGALAALLERSGLTRRELVTQLQSGQSFADILLANGINSEAFLADFLGRVEARLNVQVVDGNLSAERAAELLANLEARLQQRLDQSWQDVGEAGAGIGL